MDTHNNIHSFCYGQYNHVLLIGVQDFNALDLQEKLFFPPLSLKLMFAHEIRQTWILIIISFLFVIGTTIIFSSLGYTILMLWICGKTFLSIIFLIIKFHPRNEANLETLNNLHFFVMGTIIMFSTLGYMILWLWICKISFSFHHFPCN